MEQKELLAISQSPIFKDVEILELNRLLENHHPSVKNFRKGEVICNQDDILDRLIIVIDGKLKAQMASEEGKIISMEEFGNYQPVAIPVLFSKKNRLPVSLYAVKDSELFFLPKEMLIKCSMKNETVLTNILEMMSRKTDFLSGKIRFLQLSNIRQKISQTLIMLSKNQDSRTFKMNMTKEDLAKEMGVTRPSLSREFASLIQKEIISQDKDKITILDYDKLKDYR